MTKKIKNLNLNFGPQHPAAHGVLRLILELDGELWLRYGWWGNDEIEPRTGRKYPHNLRFDITEPFDDGAPSMVVIQWYEDGTNAVVYPDKYANGKFTLPSWVKK